MGDHLGIFRKGKEIRDPATGKVLKTIETRLGDVTITEADDNSSTGTYVGTSASQGGRRGADGAVGYRSQVTGTEAARAA